MLTHDLPHQGEHANPRSTALEENMLTIIPPMLFLQIEYKFVIQGPLYS